MPVKNTIKDYRKIIVEDIIFFVDYQCFKNEWRNFSLLCTWGRSCHKGRRKTVKAQCY